MTTHPEMFARWAPKAPKATAFKIRVTDSKGSLFCLAFVRDGDMEATLARHAAEFQDMTVTAETV